MEKVTASKIIAFIDRLEARDPTSSIYDVLKDSLLEEISIDDWAGLADLSIQANTYVPGEPLHLQNGKLGELAFCRRAMDALRIDAEVRMQVGQYLMNSAIEVEKRHKEIHGLD